MFSSSKTQCSCWLLLHVSPKMSSNRICCFLRKAFACYLMCFLEGQGTRHPRSNSIVCFMNMKMTMKPQVPSFCSLQRGLHINSDECRTFLLYFPRWLKSRKYEMMENPVVFVHLQYDMSDTTKGFPVLVFFISAQLNKRSKEALSCLKD